MKNRIGSVVYCRNRYPENPDRPIVKRTIVGHTTNGVVFDFPVIWSKDRIRGTKEDGWDANEIGHIASHSEIGKTDQDYVPKGMIIP